MRKAESIKALLIDLDGVIYQNAQLIDGAKTALAWLNQQQIPYLFLTNTTSKPLQAIVEKLTAMGVDAGADTILTPVRAAVDYLRGVEGAVSLYLPDNTQSDFSDLRLWSEGESLAAIVVGDLAEKWNFETLNQAFNLLMAHPQAQLIALGMTRYWRGANGLQLDAGPFVAALAYASGREPLVLGKPSEAFFSRACQTLGFAPESVAMIGDDPVSDVAAAQGFGLIGIQVKTGKYTGDIASSEDYLIDSIADLPSIFKSV